MKSDSYTVRVWKLFSPIFIYFGISLLVTIIYIIFTSGNLLSLYNSGGKESLDAVSKAYYERYQRDALYVTGIINLLCIPLLMYMYMKDARRIIVPEPVSSPIGYAVLAVLGVSATIFLNFFLDLTGMIKLLGGTYENSARRIYSAPFIVQIIVAAVLGPAMEELLFRGLIFKRMRTYAIVPLAVLVSAIFFGLYHLNLLQFIYAGLLGLIFAYTYEKFHSIIACIIVHGCGNGIAVVLQNNDGMSYLLAGDKTRTIITTVVTGILTLICLMVVARIKDKPVRDKQEVFTEETL